MRSCHPQTREKFVFADNCQAARGGLLQLASGSSSGADDEAGPGVELMGEFDMVLDPAVAGFDGCHCVRAADADELAGEDEEGSLKVGFRRREGGRLGGVGVKPGDDRFRVPGGLGRQRVKLLEEGQLFRVDDVVGDDDRLQRATEAGEDLRGEGERFEHVAPQRARMRPHGGDGLPEGVGFLDRHGALDDAGFVQMEGFRFGPGHDAVDFLAVEMAIGQPQRDEDRKRSDDHVAELARRGGLSVAAFSAFCSCFHRGRGEVKTEHFTEKHLRIDDFPVGGGHGDHSVGSERAQCFTQVAKCVDRWFFVSAGQAQHGDRAPGQNAICVYVVDLTEQVFQRFIFRKRPRENFVGGIGLRQVCAFSHLREACIELVVGGRRACENQIKNAHVLILPINETPRGYRLSFGFVLRIGRLMCRRLFSTGVAHPQANRFPEVSHACC